MGDIGEKERISRLWEPLVGGPAGLAGGDPGLTYRPPSTGEPTEVDPEEISTVDVTGASLPDTTTQSNLPRLVERELQLGPGFSLRARLGRGGMGIVYQVEQESLRREVAYKTPTVERAGKVDRFVSEALVTGYLEHPNIVPVHDMGADAEGRPYFTMKLVQGIAWSELLACDLVRDPKRRERARRKAEGLGLEGHLRLLVSVCHAVAFAHSRHVLHRDLKPDNVMIGDFGEVLVVDWGLAVDFSPEPPAVARAPRADRTGVGGTPAYMAPEMAWGDGSRLGPWTDVYLLGAILHELLVGRPPHDGGSLADVLISAIHGGPPELPGAPPELAAICRRALSPEIARRHPCVEDFRADIEAFLSHRESLRLAERADADLASQAKEGARSPVDRAGYDALSRVIARYEQALELWDGNEGAREGLRRARLYGARRALDGGDLGLAESLVGAIGGEDPEAAEVEGSVRRARATARRRQAAAQATRRAFLATAVALFASMAVAFVWIREERDQKEREARRADQARAREAEERRRAALRLAESLVHEAAHRLARHDWRTARQRLVESWQIHDSEGVDAARVRGALFGALDGTGLPLVTMRTAEGGVEALTFSPDGEWLASADGHAIEVRDVVSGQVRMRRPSEATAIAWSPDGTRLAIAEASPLLWEWREGAAARALAPVDDALRRVAFTPDGRRLAAAGQGGVLHLWDVETGSIAFETEALSSPVEVLRISPDGRRAFLGASLFRDVEARAWDLVRGVEIGRRAWTLQDFSGGAFSSDGTWMYTGGRDQVLRVMNVTTGEERIAMSGHRGVVAVVAVAPGGTLLASGGQDMSVRLWDPDSGFPVAVLGWHAAPVEAVAFSPDGSVLASGSSDGEINTWSTSRATVQSLTPVIDGWTGVPSIGAVAADGALLAGASHRGILTLWDLESRRQLATLEPALGAPERGRTDPATAAPLRKVERPEWRRLVDDACAELHPVTAITFAPDPERLRVAYANGLVTTWDIPAKAVVAHRRATGPVAFSRDGQLALGRFTGDELSLIDLDTGAREGGFVPPGRVMAVTLLPDARRALVATENSSGPSPRTDVPSDGLAGRGVAPGSSGSDLSFRVVDLVTGSTLLTHEGGTRHPQHLLVSEDGETFVAQGPQGGALWRIADGRKLLDLAPTLARSVGFRAKGGFFREQDGYRSIVLHAADGEELGKVGDEDPRFGVYGNPIALPESESVVSFPYLRQLGGAPVLHDLDLADRLRAQAAPAAELLGRLARGTEVTRDDWARLGRWYLAMGAAGLAARALERALGHTPLERPPHMPETQRLLAFALLRDPRAVASDRARARDLLESERSRLPSTSPARRAEQLRLQLLITSLTSPR